MPIAKSVGHMSKWHLCDPYVYLLQACVWYPVTGDAQIAFLQVQLFKQGSEAAISGARVWQHVH